MNGDDILLDTNAIIYFLEGRSRIAEHVLFAERIYYSVITEIELLSSPHLSEKDNEAIQGFLSRCLRADLTSDVVERAIHIRRTEGLKRPMRSSPLRLSSMAFPWSLPISDLAESLI